MTRGPDAKGRGPDAKPRGPDAKPRGPDTKTRGPDSLSPADRIFCGLHSFYTGPRNLQTGGKTYLATKRRVQSESVFVKYVRLQPKKFGARF